MFDIGESLKNSLDRPGAKVYVVRFAFQELRVLGLGSQAVRIRMQHLE